MSGSAPPPGGKPVAIPVAVPVAVPVRAAAAGSAGHAAELKFLKPGALAFDALPPLSLYIHLPWCARKCPYCDFNSHVWRADPAAGAVQATGTDIPEDAYIDALCEDLNQSLPAIWGRPVVSVFIGGGTPSLFSARAIGRLLDHVRAVLPLQADAEITMEANPGTFEVERLAGFRAAGVTRLSLGVQSFDDRMLHRLGRVHDAAQAKAAVARAVSLFDEVNLDLMYALPGQTLADFELDLAQALDLGTTHLSVYHLTIEPNTQFAVDTPQDLPDDELSWEIEQTLLQQAQAHGMQRYETSAYARGKRHRCRHNLNYWHFGDYLGIGAGAHGKLSFPHRIIRQVRHRHPKAYMQALSTGQWLQQETEVATDELPFEFALNALRLTEGFAPGLFSQRTGLAYSRAWLDGLDAAQTKGLLHLAPDWIAPTDLGLRFLSDLQQMFLSDETDSPR